ncbi:MAG: lactate utilization protein, partial [Acidimicrobiia bacterium]|nr:lactate utilization protein [Acidimicrobiia bacterium]
ALVTTASIHRNLVHWAHEFPGNAAETANLVIVTGPSRTGDIELELTLGVHGPRHMHVVLIK